MASTLVDGLTARQDLQIQRGRLLLAQAEREGRGLTEAEDKEHRGILQDVSASAARLEKLSGDEAMSKEIARLSGGGSSTRGTSDRGASLGAQFEASEAFAWLKATKGSRPRVWQSPVVELSAGELYGATLTEDAASGGDLIVTDSQRGIVQVATRRLVIADLFASGITTSNAVTYMKETAFTNAAAPVAESGVKPESSITFDAVTDPVAKIAHWIPATEEILEDVPQMRSYIDARLGIGLQLTEDDQLLNGSGTPPALRGILNRTGLAAPQARGTDTNSDAIAKQIAAITTATNLPVDGIVMHPTNWLTVQLTKDADGQYLMNGGPFAAPRVPILWGLPVALTTAITLGTALVGAFKTGGQLFRRTGVRVDVSNSHASFFVENKIAIRAEIREALAIYRSSSYGLVTGLL